MTLPSMARKSKPHYLEDGHDELLFAALMPIWEALMRIRSSTIANKDVDFVMANPPFNLSDWGGRGRRGGSALGFMAFLRRATLTLPDAAHDPPPKLYWACMVLANGIPSSQSSGEGDIRQRSASGRKRFLMRALLARSWPVVPTARVFPKVSGS